MNRAARDVNKIAGRCLERPPARMDGERSLQEVERFLLVVMSVRRRASSWPGDSLKDETGFARLRARDQKAYPVAWSAIHRACSCWHILDLILIWHGCDFFRCF